VSNLVPGLLFVQERHHVLCSIRRHATTVNYSECLIKNLVGKRDANSLLSSQRAWCGRTQKILRVHYIRLYYVRT